MDNKIKKEILDAFLVVMRPIVRILLRFGIGYREFLEVIKTAYVDIGSSDFGIRGRPTNISRVAVMTGLTRKEVRRLRDRIASGEDVVTVKTTPLSDVLHHWYAQEEFTNSSGYPVTLPFAGENKSFSSLVRKFGGDIPPGAMRTEMKRVGAIVENENNSLTVAERTYRPSKELDTLVTSLIHAVYPLLANVAHNTDPEREDDTWANRVAYSQLLRPREKGRLRRVAKDRIIEFTESIDDIFIAYESMIEEEVEKDEKAVVTVGVYYFEEHDKNAKYRW